MINLDIPGAIKEVSTTSYSDIQKATANKWGSRAAACYNKALFSIRKGKLTQAVDWANYGDEYYHEALEHASVMEDGGKHLKALETALKPFKRKALSALKTEINQLGQLNER